jgi:hypothetical protein
MMVDDFNDLDLSYTPPFGSPWDAVQIAAHRWSRKHLSSARSPGTLGAPT